MLRPVLLSLGAVSTLAFGSLVAGAGPRAERGDTPSLTRASSAQTSSTVQDVVAAAVIGSIARQFETSDVTVQLDRVQQIPASIQDREVVGTGRLQIAGDPEWIPFEFAAQYDTSSAEVTYPRLALGRSGSSSGELQPTLARSLDREVGDALKQEFASQPVTWSLGTATVSPRGRFLLVEADGVADFGVDGETAARVHALYDAAAKRWLRVRYELGSEAEGSLSAPAVATI